MTPDHADMLLDFDTTANDLLAGDTFTYHYQDKPIRVMVLREREDWDDIFSRHMIKYWCKRLDTDDEGYLRFGPTAPIHAVRRP